MKRFMLACVLLVLGSSMAEACIFSKMRQRIQSRRNVATPVSTVYSSSTVSVKTSSTKTSSTAITPIATIPMRVIPTYPTPMPRIK